MKQCFCDNKHCPPKGPTTIQLSDILQKDSYVRNNGMTKLFPLCQFSLIPSPLTPAAQYLQNCWKYTWQFLEKMETFIFACHCHHSFQYVLSSSMAKAHLATKLFSLFWSVPIAGGLVVEVNIAVHTYYTLSINYDTIWKIDRILFSPTRWTVR